ncbi:MAG: GIY-YIG nuclease family protein [Euryarchaeota archaeon]|jgi:Uri superfamily endonuclease|nr:GIY-YIG nuclease family protein [Euryarchaeota archaeon]
MTDKNPLRGVYCLIINLKEKSTIQVGKKGKINFEDGCYVYVGSALNSLTARINRHLRAEKKLHWHVDYLLESDHSEIAEVMYTITHERLECQVAHEISKGGMGVKGFGSSDCGCQSHLFYFSNCFGAVEACQDAFNHLKQEQKTLLDLI